MEHVQEVILDLIKLQCKIVFYQAYCLDALA